MFVLNFPKFIRKPFSAIAFYPFVLIRNESLKDNKILLNHERIHLRQQIEMLIIGFYLWYSIEFIYKYWKYGNRFQASYNISFEKESYANEKNPYYLKNRKFFAFIKYLDL